MSVTASSPVAPSLPVPHQPAYLRIATEEAYAPVEILDEYRRILEEGTDDIGFDSLWRYYLLNTSAHTDQVVQRIQDLGVRRLADMDTLGIDHQIVSLTCPGVELFEPELARRLTVLSNDRIAQACHDHPERFSGLASVYLQDVDFSISELRRSVEELGLKGVIVNSHSNGDYLDQPEFEPLIAEIARLGVPIYLHPNTPSNGLIGPLREAGLDGAIFGFGVETGMHLIRMIFSGMFDRYPDLKLVVGHLGEALPFWQFRIDHFHGVQERSGRYPERPVLRHKPSDYLKTNVWITTSGMAWEPGILFCRDVLGPDRVLYAMDYPYQAEAGEVLAQEAMPLSEQERAHFFERGAIEVFNLDLSPKIDAALPAAV